MNEELHPQCPIRNIIARFTDKLSLLILYSLSLKPTLRFNELLKEIPDISQKILTTSLRTLEEDGLVTSLTSTPSSAGQRRIWLRF